MPFSTDTRTRTNELLRLIADRLLLANSHVFESTDTDTDTLFLAEALARRYRILPALASDEQEPQPVPTITKSIGTTGRDYSTITAWEADLDSGALYASGDAAVGECYDDSAFDEAVTINGGGTVGLVSVSLTAASGQQHDGTAGTGVRIVRSSGTTTLMTLGLSFGVTCDWLEFDANGLSIAPIITTSGGTLSSGTDRYRRLLVHGAEFSASNRTIVSFASTPGRLSNSIIYDILHTATGIATLTAHSCGAGTADRTCANVTIHGIVKNNGTGACGGVVLSGVGGDCQNVVVTDVGGTTSGTKTCFSGSSRTVNHNASSDATATGTGSLTSIVTADQYVSTVVGSEDLHLKAGSDCIDAGTDLGTTPTGVNIDIDGRDRDAEGDTWDIGADEFVSAGGALALVISGSRFSSVIGTGGIVIRGAM